SGEDAAVPVEDLRVPGSQVLRSRREQVREVAGHRVSAAGLEVGGVPGARRPAGIGPAGVSLGGVLVAQARGVLLVLGKGRVRADGDHRAFGVLHPERHHVGALEHLAVVAHVGVWAGERDAGAPQRCPSASGGGRAASRKQSHRQISSASLIGSPSQPAYSLGSSASSLANWTAYASASADELSAVSLTRPESAHASSRSGMDHFTCRSTPHSWLPHAGYWTGK